VRFDERVEVYRIEVPSPRIGEAGHVAGRDGLGDPVCERAALLRGRRIE
jgi:hypothetical protein